MPSDAAEEAPGDLREVSVDLRPFVKLRALGLKFSPRREKKELQKLLDRKRQNSISEAKSRDKDKAEV